MSDGRELKNGAPEDPASQTAHSGGLDDTPPDRHTLLLVAEQIVKEVHQLQYEIVLAEWVEDATEAWRLREVRSLLWDDYDAVQEAVAAREGREGRW